MRRSFSLRRTSTGSNPSRGSSASPAPAASHTPPPAPGPSPLPPQWEAIFASAGVSRSDLTDPTRAQSIIEALAATMTDHQLRGLPPLPGVKYDHYRPGFGELIFEESGDFESQSTGFSN